MRGAAGTFVSPSLPISLTRASPPRTGTPPNRPGEPAAPPRASTPAPSTPSAPSTPLAQSAPSIPPADLQPPRRPQPIAVALSGEPARCNPGPALDAFPRKVWHRLVSLRARSGERALLGYPNPAGYRPLREHIATYLTLSRGVTCVPDQASSPAATAPRWN